MDEKTPRRSAPPHVAFEDVPAVYVQWNRADYPEMTDAAIAERWRWKSDAVREFWTRLAPPPPRRRVPELGAVAYEAAENAPLRERIAGLERERDSLTGRIEGLVTKGSELRERLSEMRELVGEILDSYAATDSRGPAVQAQIAKWRQRAGLELVSGLLSAPRGASPDGGARDGRP